MFELIWRTAFPNYSTSGQRNVLAMLLKPISTHHILPCCHHPHAQACDMYSTTPLFWTVLLNDISGHYRRLESGRIYSLTSTLLSVAWFYLSHIVPCKDRHHCRYQKHRQWLRLHNQMSLIAFQHLPFWLSFLGWTKHHACNQKLCLKVDRPIQNCHTN